MSNIGSASGVGLLLPRPGSAGHASVLVRVQGAPERSHGALRALQGDVLEHKQEKSPPSGKIMFYSMDEHTHHAIPVPLLPDLMARAGVPVRPSWLCCWSRPLKQQKCDHVAFPGVPLVSMSVLFTHGDVVTLRKPSCAGHLPRGRTILTLKARVDETKTPKH